MTYQGVLIVKDKDIGSKEDWVYFAPSQLEEYKKYIHGKQLPDGRVILKYKIFDEPVNRRSLEDCLVFPMMLDSVENSEKK